MLKIKEVLKQFSVELIVPKKGEFFNEYEQEPIAVVEEPSMETEQIKELVRYGYYYEGTIYGQERFIIRPAQVMVVKNSEPVENKVENKINEEAISYSTEDKINLANETESKEDVIDEV